MVAPLISYIQGFAFGAILVSCILNIFTIDKPKPGYLLVLYQITTLIGIYSIYWAG
jgi:hypothetical protein